MRGRWVDPAAPWCSSTRRPRPRRRCARRARSRGARTGDAPAARRRLRRLSHRPAARAKAISRCTRGPIVPGHQIVGARRGRRRRRRRMARRRSRRRRLAGRRRRHLRQVPLGAREPVRARDVHRLGRRRRLRDARRRARRLRACALPDGFDDLAAAPLLCGGVIGYRSLKRSGDRAGRPPRPVRLRRLGADRAADRAGTGAAGSSSRTRAPAERERARALGAEWAGGNDDGPPEPLDAAMTFAPSGDVVRAALRAVDRGATVAINAIHLDRLPEMPYEELWWERRLASVANFTRADAREFLALAAAIPVRTSFETHPLADANVALARLVPRRGRRRRRAGPRLAARAAIRVGEPLPVPVAPRSGERARVRGRRARQRGRARINDWPAR